MMFLLNLIFMRTFIG